MYPRRNLISKSEKVTNAIKLLRSFGGRTSLVKFAKRFWGCSLPLAFPLIEELSHSDPRIRVSDGFIELVPLEKQNPKLSETSFVVLDIEATDPKFPPGRILEIGAYKVWKKNIIEEFHTLINPGFQIPTFIKGLTGISDGMVEKAPEFSQIVLQLLDFIDDAVLVAHNARFDIRFLNYEIGRIYEDYYLVNPQLCTVQLSRKLLPQLENHRLTTLAQHYSVKIKNLHRADQDAKATAEIFIYLLDELERRGIRDLEGIKKIKSSQDADAITAQKNQ